MNNSDLLAILTGTAFYLLSALSGIAIYLLLAQNKAIEPLCRVDEVVYADSLISTAETPLMNSKPRK